MSELNHFIESYGIDRAILMHEERILYSYNHPRNPFFFGVRKDSEEKLKQLKQKKNDTKKV